MIKIDSYLSASRCVELIAEITCRKMGGIKVLGQSGSVPGIVYDNRAQGESGRTTRIIYDNFSIITLGSQIFLLALGKLKGTDYFSGIGTILACRKLNFGIFQEKDPSQITREDIRTGFNTNILEADSELRNFNYTVITSFGSCEVLTSSPGLLGERMWASEVFNQGNDFSVERLPFKIGRDTPFYRFLPKNTSLDLLFVDKLSDRVIWYIKNYDKILFY